MGNEYYLNSISHHGVNGQKWGVRRYQNYDGSLTPAGRERYGESKQLASQLFEKAKDHEPRITKDVMDSVNGTSAKMYGLEHKLKTEESLTRKIRTDSEEKKITPFDAAYGIKDGVRYTALSPDNDFTSNYYKIKNSLEKKGYSEVRCKNYFDLYRQGQVKHKSVQSVFQSDDGYLFEMQFQTKASQDAKDKKVPIYEERRKPGLSKERQEALERQMVELAENVPDPKDVYKIKTHSSIKHSLVGDSMNYDELVHTLFAEKPPEEEYLAHHGVKGQKSITKEVRKMDDFLKVGEDYLAHHGVLGMKWGEQNGPPYPIKDGGHSRSEKEAAKQAGIQVGKDSGFDSIETLKSIQNSSKQISDSVRKFKKGPKHKKRDLSSYSDDELRYEVARRSLEDQYNKLLDNDDYVKSSQYAIDKALDKVGDTAITIGAITGAAVSIATLIKMSKTG